MTVGVDLRVLELLMSKLCHDLVGPVTGLSAGVELARSMSGAVDDDTLDLLAFSVAQASARLQFFRLAFGTGGSEADAVALDKIGGFCRDLVDGSRLVADFPGRANDRPGDRTRSAPDHLSKNDARLALNLFVLASECLPRGGRVVYDGDGVCPSAFLAVGQGVRPAEGLESVLAGTVDVATLTPRTVLPHFVASLAGRSGRRLILSQAGEDRLRVAAAPL